MAIANSAPSVRVTHSSSGEVETPDDLLFRLAFAHAVAIHTNDITLQLALCAHRPPSTSETFYEALQRALTILAEYGNISENAKTILILFSVFMYRDGDSWLPFQSE